MPTAADDVAAELGLSGARPTAMQGTDPAHPGNGNWLLRTGDGQPVVLRRYHVLRTEQDLAFEARVLAHLTAHGWNVPTTVAGPIRYDGRWWAATRFVPGCPHRDETPPQQVERGGLLARLHADLRGLDPGQRPGFFQGCDLPAMGDFQDWDLGVRALREVRPDLADWADAAMANGQRLVAQYGLLELPQTVVHGDFAEWNLHFGEDGALDGVIDFDLTHRDSRSWELVIARVHRSPGLLMGYQEAAADLGMPLTADELVAIEPLQQVFRVNMVMAELWNGRHAGTFNLSTVERQLSRTGVPRA
ncbi:aminoglycoside phosphotransferase [Kribbella flavida DSM 17836]|uniref:Aminoglycoside phosphotransferase n=1 Tax=Kribbella flavida (strain DSM 17836 / JCM 10339 / NBRC 14399) TaxID=479435 RepID=D2PUW3_KRIFD|nr:phosphotransferase [Kribbella flavida]ADB31429.1 aminoglycoside phosphotransferase [Kribbella flavida DSM 17836]